MCSFAGVINFKKNLFAYEAYNKLLVRDMIGDLSQKNTDIWVGEHAAFAHINNHSKIVQPIKKTVEGHEFVITFIGNLQNILKLKKELSKFGYQFTSDSDAEIAIFSYIHYGENCCKKLEGNFCFCVWDSMRQQVFICRDKSANNQFFYIRIDNTILVSSDIQSLFHYPNVNPKIDKDGLRELFSHFPYKAINKSILKDVEELNPANYMIINRCGIHKKKYSDFEIYPSQFFDLKLRTKILKPLIAKTLNLDDYDNNKCECFPFYNMSDNPFSNEATKQILIEVLEDKTSPINIFVDRKNALETPELMWFLIVLNNWFKEFNPTII